MKKAVFLICCALCLILALSASAAVSVELGGAMLDMRDVNGNEVAPFIEDGTTYVPVRAIANGLGLVISWDSETSTVFIGDKGSAAPEKGDAANIFINGKKFNPTDVNGKSVPPIIKDGTTYLPVRAVAQAFAKKVDWRSEDSTVVIKDSARIDTSKTYQLRLYGTDSVITPAADSSGSALALTVGKGAENELWRFSPVAGEDGFYQIVNAKSGCAMDVNGESRTAGAKILQYNKGNGENQKFMLVLQENGTYKIFAKHSMLPFEASAGEVKQNTERTSAVQNWELVEITAPKAQPEKAAVYRTLTVKGTGAALTYKTDANELVAASLTGGENQQWLLVPDSAGCYAVNTRNGGRSIDVANNSTTEGDPLITYASSSDDNQRWFFEKQSGGAYKLKSVSSELYLTVNSDGSVTQTSSGTEIELTEVK